MYSKDVDARLIAQQNAQRCKPPEMYIADCTILAIFPAEGAGGAIT